MERLRNTATQTEKVSFFLLFCLALAPFTSAFCGAGGWGGAFTGGRLPAASGRAGGGPAAGGGPGGGGGRWCCGACWTALRAWGCLAPGGAVPRLCEPHSECGPRRPESSFNAIPVAWSKLALLESHTTERYPRNGFCRKQLWTSMHISTVS